MAPRPKTYGNWRSRAKPAGVLVNGTASDESEPEPILKDTDVVSAMNRMGKENGLGTVHKIGKLDMPSPNLENEEESTAGKPMEEPPSQTLNVAHKSRTTSPAPRSLETGGMLAPDMLTPDTSTNGRELRSKSIRRLVNGSSASEIQNVISNKGFESSPADHYSPSHATARFRQNDFTEDHQQSPVILDIDLKDAPSDLHNLGIWVAQMIRKCSDKSPISAISEPKSKASSPQPGQHIAISDTLNDLEDVRMTRGKEKKRLQQLMGKEPTNCMSLHLSYFCNCY